VRDFIKLVTVLTTVCIIAALALSMADKKTRKARERQDRLARLEAIAAVLPEYDNQPDKEKVEFEGVTFYLARKNGEIVGLAFEQEAEGYGGKIRVMIGLDPQGELIGIDIVKHSETPGLGALIDQPEENNPFKDQFFREKRVRRDKPPLILESNIAVAKDGGEIEAITGATISSRVVCEAVKKGLNLFFQAEEKILGKE